MKKGLRLARRSVLKGVAAGSAITVGLPALDCMFNNNGTALAQGGPIPKRFGVWYWGGGTDYSHFTPSGGPKGWKPNAGDPAGQLLPLAVPGLQERTTIISNLDWGSYDAKVVHGAQRCIVLSGSWAVGVPELYASQDRVAGATRPSIDQVVSDAFKAKGNSAAFPYINLRISNANGLTNTTSFRGTTKYSSLPMQSNPQAAWDSLFKNRRLGCAGVGQGSQRELARKYVVDAVRDDVLSLANQVGKVDRERLDNHLEGLMSLEKRIAGLSQETEQQATPEEAPCVCHAPQRSTTVTGSNPMLRAETDADGEVGHSELLKPVHDLMAEILYYALACDLTRVFALEFTGTQTSAIFSEIGINEAHHIQLTHRGQTAKIGKTVRFTMENLAVFLNLLASSPEGDGVMLDNMGIYITSESSNAGSHLFDAPIIIAGRAGGALKSGQYIDADQALATRFLLSLCKSVGANISTFGDQGGRTTEPHGAILA